MLKLTEDSPFGCLGTHQLSQLGAGCNGKIPVIQDLAERFWLEFF